MVRRRYFIGNLYKTLILVLFIFILSASTMNKHKEQLKKIEGEITKNKQLIKAAQKKENIALHDMDNIDQKLSVSKKKISDLKRSLRKTKANIDYLHSRITGLEKNFKSIKGNTKSAVKNWYIMNILYNKSETSVPENVNDIFKFEILKRLNKKNYDYIQMVLSKKNNYSAKMLNYQLEFNKLKKMQALFELESQNIHSEKQLKKIYLSKIKKKKSSYKSYLINLEKRKRKIQKDIQTLLRRAAAKHKVNASKKGVISAYRHMISSPVDGVVTSKFGKYWNKEYEITINNDGIEINAQKDNLFSPCAGTVIFADWLKGKGNVIIISYDSHLSLIFGDLDDIFVKKGDKLEKKQLIGKIGKDTSNKRILYFGTWLDSKPVNPEYIIKR